MSESLSQQPQRRTGRYQFLAHKAEIAKLYENGMTVVMIWEKLRDENRLALSYPQFARYVRDHLKDKPAADITKDKAAVDTEKKPVPTPTQPKSFGFKPYDPSDKDNLI